MKLFEIDWQDFFAITKKSVLSAAGSGMTATTVLEILERPSAKPVPTNVAREIAGWFGQALASRSARPY